VCHNIIAERAANEPGLELMLKSLVTQLIVLLLREKYALTNKNTPLALSVDEQKTTKRE
jgi:hypothetical protein